MNQSTAGRKTEERKGKGTKTEGNKKSKIIERSRGLVTWTMHACTHRMGCNTMQRNVKHRHKDNGFTVLYYHHHLIVTLVRVNEHEN